MSAPKYCWKCTLIASNNPGVKCMKSVPEDGPEKLLIPGPDCPLARIAALLEELEEVKYALMLEQDYSTGLEESFLSDNGF